MSEFQIKADKSVLLDTLLSNRAKHLREYEAAKEGYEKLLKRELETKLRVLAKVPAAQQQVTYTNGQSEGDLSRVVNQKPQSYQDHYDQAIEMLEFGIDQTINLNFTQYRQYVKNEWNWTSQFTASNTAYIAAAAR